MSPMTNSPFGTLMSNDLAPNEEISTLFIVGFPDDMQEREFQNMFLFSSGFEASRLKVPAEEDPSTHRKQIIGFAKFRTRVEALEARDLLCGRRVDADKGCVLKAEMARKNLHTKRGRLQAQQQQRRPASANEAFHSTFGPMTPPPPPPPPPPQSDENDIVFRLCALPPSPSPSASSARQQQQHQQSLSINTNSSPYRTSSPDITSPTIRQSILGIFDTHIPCNSLYGRNLHFNPNQDDLKALSSRPTGFRRVPLKPKLNSGPMRFVEYDNATCAAQVLWDYNGALLSSSVKGGIRLPFSNKTLGSRQSSTTIVASPGGVQRESISWPFDTLQMA